LIYFKEKTIALSEAVEQIKVLSWNWLAGGVECNQLVRIGNLEHCIACSVSTSVSEWIFMCKGEGMDVFN